MTPGARRIDELMTAASSSLEEMRRLLPIVREHRLRCPEGGQGETSPVERKDERAILACLAAADQVRKAADGLRAQAPLPVAKPSCRVCGRTGGPFRRGLDGKCRMAWDRADRPPLEAWIASQHELVPSAGSAVPPPVVPLRIVGSGALVSDGRRPGVSPEGADRQGPTAAAS